MLKLRRSLRKLTKSAVVYGARIVMPKRTKRVFVLCYHSVHPSKRIASATPEQFEEHLVWLKANTRVVAFRDILNYASHISDVEVPIAAITFDDGYADNYEYAFPLLKKYEVHATFFLTVGLLEKIPTVLNRFMALWSASYSDIVPLDWEQVLEMRRAGMDFGAHTFSHPNLLRLSPGEAYQELRNSKEFLEEKLGEKVVLLAYPFGKPRRHFSCTTMEIAAEVGYKAAAAIAYRSVAVTDHPLSIPRFFVTRDNLTTLQAKIMGAYDLIGWWHEHSPLWLSRLVTPEDFRV